LHLFECLEIGERYTKTFRKLFSRGGKQIGLLVHRKQRVDRARFDDIGHGGQIAVRIGAGCGRPMHVVDEAREASKAHWIARHQFDPVPGEPQRRDGLARGQAGAFAEQNLGSWHAHSPSP
jgi:hypothetical protein